MSGRLDCLDLWLALGCSADEFGTWYDHPKLTPADAWAQLLASIRGSTESLLADSNPPAPRALIGSSQARSVHLLTDPEHTLIKRALDLHRFEDWKRIGNTYRNLFAAAADAVLAERENRLNE